MAKEQKQATAMIAASTGKAKVTGLEIQRIEQGKPGDFSQANDTATLAGQLLRQVNPSLQDPTPKMLQAAAEELRRHTAIITAIAQGSPSSAQH